MVVVYDVVAATVVVVEITDVSVALLSAFTIYIYLLISLYYRLGFCYPSDCRHLGRV